MSLLIVSGVSSFYGDFQALFDVSLSVDEGETVAMIGANGAGKSTLLRLIAGLVPNLGGEVRYDGRVIDRLPTHERVRAGISLVPEGRRVFPSLSVEENLKIGAYRKRPGRWNVGEVYALFPNLGAIEWPQRCRSVGGRAAGPRDRAGVDGQSALAPPRRGVARARADRHRPAVRGTPVDPRTGHLRPARRAEHRPSARGGRSRVLPAGGPRVTLGSAGRTLSTGRDAQRTSGSE